MYTKKHLLSSIQQTYCLVILLGSTSFSSLAMERKGENRDDKQYNNSSKNSESVIDCNNSELQREFLNKLTNQKKIDQNYIDSNLALAKDGDAYAQYNMGQLYCQGRGVKKDMDLAFQYFHLAALQKQIDAQFWLGYMYLYGYGTNQNIGKAFDNFTLAADQNDISAYFVLGLMHFDGIGIKQNFNEAFLCLRYAARQGHPSGQCHLGSMYYQGLGTKKDLPKAMELFLESAQQNDKFAQYNIAAMYLNNAEKYYQEAANKIYGEYDDEIEIRLANEAMGEAIKYFSQAAKQNHGPSLYRLGLIYYENKYRDVPYAIECFVNASNQGCSDASYKLACIYDGKKNGGQDNLKRVFFYYKLAADQGNAEAQFTMAGKYFGKSQRAFELLKRAADQGHAAAQYQVATMYEDGIAVDSNAALAFKYYQLAADQNNSDAQYKVASMLFYGHGTNKNIDKAFAFYLLAAKCGHAHAQYEVANRYYQGEGTRKNVA